MAMAITACICRHFYTKSNCTFKYPSVEDSRSENSNSHTPYGFLCKHNWMALESIEYINHYYYFQWRISSKCVQCKVYSWQVQGHLACILHQTTQHSKWNVPLRWWLNFLMQNYLCSMYMYIVYPIAKWKTGMEQLSPFFMQPNKITSMKFFILIE